MKKKKTNQGISTNSDKNHGYQGKTEEDSLLLIKTENQNKKRLLTPKKEPMKDLRKGLIKEPEPKNRTESEKLALPSYTTAPLQHCTTAPLHHSSLHHFSLHLWPREGRWWLPCTSLKTKLTSDFSPGNVQSPINYNFYTTTSMIKKLLSSWYLVNVRRISISPWRGVDPRRYWGCPYQTF